MNATDATASFVFSKGGSYKVCYKLKVKTMMGAFSLCWPPHNAPHMIMALLYSIRTTIPNLLMVWLTWLILEAYSGTVWQASVNFTQVGTELLTITTNSIPETEFREVV